MSACTAHQRRELVEICPPFTGKTLLANLKSVLGEPMHLDPILGWEMSRPVTILSYSIWHPVTILIYMAYDNLHAFPLNWKYVHRMDIQWWKKQTL